MTRSMALKSMIQPWGHQNEHAPNRVGLEALVNKYGFFTGYELNGPGINYSGFASGATDDWAYAMLGAAGMTFEIGTQFHQPCGAYFENTIMTRNIQALDYALSVSFAPYALPQGPDIVQAFVALTTPNRTSADDAWSVVTLVVQASDSAYSVEDHETSKMLDESKDMMMPKKI